MCGIAGCITPNHKEEIKRLVDDLYHRGPDDNGFFHDEACSLSLGMRRLSIMDLKGGKQPIFSQCRKFLIFFNGEIFNATFLRKELNKYGYKFSTDHSDTEVFVAGISLFGKTFINKLNGMFAAIIYNLEENKLTLIRDHIGIKPLYYAIFDNKLLISSEISSLKNGIYHFNISSKSTAHFLSFGHIQPGHTIYKEINQVNPGCFIDIDVKNLKKEVNQKRYWSPHKTKSSKKINRKDLYFYINEAVKRWTSSDVPISLSFSGGTDSSILLHHLVKNDLKPNCYTVNFEEDHNSLEFQNRQFLIKKYNLKLNQISYKDIDIANDIDKMVESLGEPYSGSLVSWLIYKSASNEKVMLSGTGGDELFGNYGKWQNYNYLGKKFKSYSKNLLNNNFINYLINKNAYRYFPKFFDFKDVIKILNRENARLAWSDLSKAIGLERKASRPSLYDLWGQLSSEFLSMSDRFSMQHSIELRTPFLDMELIEYVISSPYNERSYFKYPKQFLLDTYEEYIPSLKLLVSKEGFTHGNNLLLGCLREYFLDITSKKSIANSIIKDSEMLKIIRNMIINKDQSLSTKLMNKAWIIFMFRAWENKFIE